MHTRVKITSAVLFSLCATSALAGPYADAIGQCFANATTGKERIELAKWVFVNIALHPEVAGISAIAPEKREEINKATGAVFNRLLTDACAKEVKDAIKFGDQTALKTAFESLGKLAMQEIMNNAAVGSGFSGLEKFIDTKKIKRTLE
jgi:hypothetical protein